VYGQVDAAATRIWGLRAAITTTDNGAETKDQNSPRFAFGFGFAALPPHSPPQPPGAGKPGRSSVVRLALVLIYRKQLLADLWGIQSICKW
jgi:hypothetical protein